MTHLRDRLPFTAVSTAWRAGYGLHAFRKDVGAGLTVGIVAIPLAMALAIAVGVPPQHGLYTAIIAGFIIALTGGSRFNVSGPTAAFVVILMPITHDHGVGGLLLATMMSGLILMVMGLGGLGRLIRFIPHPVVVGFTAGIAVVIATLQLKDLLGLTINGSSGHFIDQLLLITGALHAVNWPDLLVGALTLLILLAWPRFRTAVPAPLIALFAAGLGTWLAGRYWPGLQIETIASRFSYEIDGQVSAGIPPLPPVPEWPWRLPGVGGEPLVLNWALFRSLIGPSFAIAMLGAIESLLCGVIADGLTGTRHQPNAELVGQGLGNLVAPLFGGITATAAIARTATNVRFGARSPVAAMVHALVVLAAVLFMTGLLSLLPMAALAALLLTVAWNMSDAPHFARIIRTAPGGDVAVLVTCFGLTVLFDMVVAVAVGVGLAGMLFIHRMADITSSSREPQLPSGADHLPNEIARFRIRGPLFFGAAERALSTLHRVEPEIRVIILNMQDVPSMDISAIMVFRSMIEQLHHRATGVIIVGATSRIIVKLRRAGIGASPGKLQFCRDDEHAVRTARSWIA